MEEGKKSFPIKWIIYGAIGLWVLGSVVFGGGSGGDDYIEETLEEPTQGIIVELQETEKDLFKITNEELLPNRVDSKIIANYMDNTSDTFSIDEVKLMEANDPRRSLIRTAAMAGMFGYVMGRPMSSGVSRGAYANQGAYDKSNNQGRSQMRSSAKKSTVRRSTGSSGYGSGKSTRSYGG